MSVELVLFLGMMIALVYGLIRWIPLCTMRRFDTFPVPPTPKSKLSAADDETSL